MLFMHDHLEELGRNIVRRLHPHEPRRHTRLWIDEEIIDILVNESGTEETLCIKLKRIDLNSAIIMKGLGKMKELRLLYVEDVCVTEEVDKGSQCLPDALQYLYWRPYPFCFLPKTFHAKKLVNLEMAWSNITELWQGGERKVLNKLKFLDLHGSKLRTFDLTLTPDLQELNLEECDHLFELHMPVKCLNLKFLNLNYSKVSNINLWMTPHLEHLDLRGCSDFVELQMPVECPNLKILDLSCSKVANLNLGMTPHLEKLDLGGCVDFVELHMPVECLDLKILTLKVTKAGNLNLGMTPNLEMLDLDACNEFELHMPVECPKLIYLKIRGSKVNEPGYSWMGNIEKLIYSGLCPCKNLEYWSATICGLQHLRGLSVDGSIPEDLWQLESLEKLSLNMVEIRHLPDSICVLKHLKSLEISNCLLIEQLPEEICRLECLEELYLWSCTSLRDIPNSICKLKWLKYLRVVGCDKVEKLPEKLGCLKYLEKLELGRCKSLQGIPNSICKMKCLKRLDLSSCDQVENLPEEIGCLECLKELNIFSEGISRLRLPQSIFQLKGVRITGSREQLESYGFTSFTESYPGSLNFYAVEL
ncbi:putative leucine-rich repeat domain superfamily [Helianthus annuus]|nr:putative leucine-rich repeat domain superfamily [Helianthus annuus]